MSQRLEEQADVTRRTVERSIELVLSRRAERDGATGPLQRIEVNDDLKSYQFDSLEMLGLFLAIEDHCVDSLDERAFMNCQTVHELAEMIVPHCKAT